MSFNNRNNKIKVFIESALIAGIMAVYILLGLHYIPIIGALFPIPYIILGTRNGIRTSILSMLASVLIVSILKGLYIGVFILITFAPLSIALTYLIRKKSPSQTILVIATIICLLSNLASIKLLGRVSGIDLASQLELSFKHSLDIQMDTMKDMGFSGYELHRTENFLENAFDYILLIVPSIIIAFSLLTSYLNYSISIGVLNRLGYEKTKPKFSYFRLPGNIILGTIAMFLISYLLKKLKISYYDTIFVNVTVLATLIFFIQGLAVIAFLLNKTKLSGILKTAIIVFVVIFVPIGGIVSLVGLLDAIFNFRKIRSSI